MADQTKIESFSKEKQRFFNGLRSAAHARNRVKYMYEVAIMPDDRANLAKNKLYLEMFPGVLQYTFIGSSGDEVVDFIPFSELNQGLQAPVDIIDPLTLPQLEQVLPSLFEITSKRGHNGFHFVAEYRSLIEQDFADLYTMLSKNGGNDELWRLCYFWCHALEEYYSDASYPDPGKAKKYHDARIKLEWLIETKGLPEQEQHAFAASIGQQILDGFSDVADTVQHTTSIRAWLGFFNLYRILFLFSRLAIKQGLILAHQMKWLDNLAQLFNRTIDLNILVSMINSPTSIFNALSVGIFEIRLFIMLCEAFKHVVLAPTEKEESRTRTERFKEEIFIRIVDLYNDIAWAAVNTLCNYGYLAGPVADWLTAAFLLLDAAALLCSLYLNYKEYEFKKAQYQYERILLGDDGQLAKDMVDGQLRELEIDWAVKKARILFATAGASVLMVGFSASLLLTGPAVATTCFLACTLAVAMYLSTGKYGDYVKASLDQQGNVDAAHNAFAMSMVKNSIMPLVMVTAFAVYWPAALVLAVAYIAHESSGKPMPQTTAEWQPADGGPKAAMEHDEQTEDIRLLTAPAL